MGMRRAVIVGVRDYSKAGTSDLKYTANDAARCAKALVEHCEFDAENVALFHDGPSGTAGLTFRPPHRSDILATLEEFASNSGPGDMLVFFFAGHGGEISEKHYLLTNDTRLNVIDQTALDVRLINAAMEESKADFTIRFFDACRASADGRRDALSRPMTPGFNNAICTGGAASVTLSACSSGEYAYEHPDLKHGLFSYYLCRALEGEASVDGGAVTIEGLVHYVKLGVATECEKRSFVQKPHYFGSSSGSQILVNKRPKPPISRPTERPARPLDDVGALITAIHVHQDEIARAAQMTNASQLGVLHRALFDRIAAELGQFASDSFELSRRDYPPDDPNIDLYNPVRRSLARDRLGTETNVMLTATFTLMSRRASLPGLTLDVAVVRICYFFRAYYRMRPVPPDPSLMTKFSPLEIFDFITILSSVIANDAKLDAVADGILSRVGSAFRTWVEQCASAVESVLKRERERGNVIH